MILKTFPPVVVLTLAVAATATAQLVLDDPLQGSTTGTRSGGAFVAGGWKVTNTNDYIYWHVPTISEGAVEFDLSGINPNECRPDMTDKTEIFHMYDYTFGNADNNYFGGYRDSPHKHLIRKTGCDDPPRVNSLEVLWQILPEHTEPDTAILSWDPAVTYRFRVEWGPDGGGNSVVRIYRSGVLLRTMSLPGSWSPPGHSVRIAASPRAPLFADFGAPVDAVYSNVKMWDLSADIPAAPTLTSPTQGQTVNTTLAFVEWTGGSHTRYQVRVNTQNDPDAGVVWDSQDTASAKDFSYTGELDDDQAYYAFVRLGSALGFGPWSSPGRQFMVDTSFVPPGPDIVRLAGDAITRKSGPFNGLGVTYMQAMRRCKFDRNRYNSDLAFLASKEFNYVRILTMVGWYDVWQGLEIAPVNFNNENGTFVAAWPDYWQQFRDTIDIAYDDHGLLTQVTIFADAQLMPNKNNRISHMQTILDNLAGREHKVIMIEVANEAWQNGFPDSQGIADLREFAQYLAERTSILVAITDSQGQDNASITNLYNGSAADIATEHFTRDVGTIEGGWLPVRAPWDVESAVGVPPVSSNEPVGPGSSVSTENDPIKLVMAAAFAWGANLPMYVYHTDAGVFGLTTFESKPGVGDFVHLNDILPPDFAGWVRNDGKEAAAPFTTFANGQANKWWTEVGGPTTGVVRNTGKIKGHEFITLPIGILAAGVTIEARRDVSFEVYNPLTGQVVLSTSRIAGQQVTLPQGPGAYVIRGVFDDIVAPHAFGDLDGDGDVDLNDYGFLQMCMSGTGFLYPPGCGPADLDDDFDVDSDDVDALLPCMNGSNLPPGC